jgi:hypothetical protein
MASTGFGIPARRMRMKGLAASLALAVALSLLPAQAASGDTVDLTAGVFPDDLLAAQSSTGDPFAVGGGTTATGTHFAFSAHCKDATELEGCPADSGTASGYAVVSDPVLGKAQGHVCAMEVVGGLSGPPPFVGNFAGLGVVVEKGSGFLGSFPYLVVEAVDSGEGPGSLPDLFVARPFTSCVSAQKEPRFEPVARGNIVIKP